MPGMKSIMTAAVFLAAYACLPATGFSQDDGHQAAQNCKAPARQQSPGGGNTAGQDPEITGSTRLSDCDGVISPPETGDGTLVQPAPQSGNMPVVKPKGLTPQQQNAK